MKNTLRILLCGLAVMLLMPSLPFGLMQDSLSAQTTTTQTVLATAIANATANVINVASNTGFLASTSTQEQDVFVDGELMKLQSQIGTTTNWFVSRGINRTRASAHPTGSIVFFGPAGRGPFVSQPPYPGSSCTANQFQFLPLIVYATGGPSSTAGNALIANCVGSVWNITSLQPNNDLRPITLVNDTAYSATLADEYIVFQNLTAGRTITLPAITGLIGKTYVVSNATANGSTITVSGSAGQLFGTGAGTGTATVTFTGAGAAQRYISANMGTTWLWVTW